jgi:hypothetical protein
MQQFDQQFFGIQKAAFLNSGAGNDAFSYFRNAMTNSFRRWGRDQRMENQSDKFIFVSVPSSKCLQDVL